MKREIEEQEQVIFKSVILSNNETPNKNGERFDIKNPVMHTGIIAGEDFYTSYSLDSSLSFTPTYTVNIKRLTETAKIPTKKDGDAGWDLYADEDVIVRPQERMTIHTSIAMEIPEDYVGLIWPRSGLSVKNGIDVFAGVIDSSYRGEIMVCLYNSNYDRTKDLYINKGDRIAQMLFHYVPSINMNEVDELSDSQRGNKGFGSSGA